MTNTRVNIKGVDPNNIASESDAQAGVAVDKLSTSYSTKVAIDYNVKNLPAIGRGLAYTDNQSFTVNSTSLIFPIQLFAMSDYTTTENTATLTKLIASTFTAGDGNGCLDTGTIANSTYYYVYGISDATNTTFDALISLSPTSPTLPSGFTKSIRLGTLRTNSIGQIDQYKSFISTMSYSGSPQVHTAIYGTPASLYSQYVIQFNSTIGSEASKFSFDSSGNFTASGNVTAFSDIRVKHNIKDLDFCLDKVKMLRGVSFSRINETSTNIGLIAQEVENVLPEVVLTHDDGLKSVAYQNIVAVLIEAVKELSDKVEKLEKNNGS